MFENATNMNHLWAALLVEELVRGGACCFCLSPGSRNAPLSVAVAENPRARPIVHFDERGAAFHALGWARATGRPAALVCTSGSAVANYWPAVVEAACSRIPLILLTADRPPELLACGANQAIDQPGLFGGYVRWSFVLPCPDAHVPPAVVLTTVDQALYRAVREPAGPVHINCMFREPLAPTPSGQDQVRAYGAPLAAWAEGCAPYTTWRRPEVRLSSEEEHHLINRINDVERGVLVLGELRDEAESAAAQELADALGWPVFPDVASGLRLHASCRHTVAHYDQLLLSERFRAKCRPETVLHVGGRLTSKRLLEHLAALTAEYILVAEHPERADPGHCVTRRLEADVAGFCSWLAPSIRDRGAPAWGREFPAASEAAAAAIDAWLAGHNSVNEVGVARGTSRMRPEGSVLLLGNSMPVRDMDMFGAADGARGRAAVKRGASGIDGCIAMAAGYANALECLVTAVLGDMAVLHDLPSLALLRRTAAPVVLVILNNNGGGIFSFLPIAEYPRVCEPYFAAPHGLGFASAAKLFGLAYAQPTSMKALAREYRKAVRRDGPTIIEVQTRRDENVQVHRELQEAVVAAVERTLA